MSDEHDIRLLDRSHGAALLELSRACPIEADFTFLFAREPDFFAWPDAVFPSYRYRGVFREGKLVAAALTAVVRGGSGFGHGLYSYAGDLRVLPEERGRGLGSALVADCHRHYPADYPEVGIALVKDGNVGGARMIDLGDGRGTLPGLVLCRVLAMNVPLVRRLRGPGACRVRRATERDVEALAALYGRVLSGRPFAPSMTAESLAGDAAAVPGLGLDRYYLAEKDGRLVGAFAAWDQGALRRTVVLRYSGLGRLQRAAYGAAGWAFGTRAAMPQPGQPLRAVAASRVAVEGDDPAVLADLLAALTADHAGAGYHLATFGFPEGDPLLPGLKGSFAQAFPSRLFLGQPRSTVQAPVPAGSGRPYVEFALV